MKSVPGYAFDFGKPLPSGGNDFSGDPFEDWRGDTRGISQGTLIKIEMASMKIATRPLRCYFFFFFFTLVQVLEGPSALS